MANIGAVASSVGKGSAGIFGKLLKVRWGYVFIIVLFVQALALGFENGGGIEIIKSLGERFLGITQDLQIISIGIIENGAVFDGWLHFLATIWGLFSNLYLMYMWIKLFSYLFSKSPFSNESEGFKNNSAGIFFFLLLQIFYLMLFSSPIDGQTNLDLFKTPITSFIDLFHAVVKLFTSTNFDKMIYYSDNIDTACFNNTCTF